MEHLNETTLSASHTCRFEHYVSNVKNLGYVREGWDSLLRVHLILSTIKLYVVQVFRLRVKRLY